MKNSSNICIALQIHNPCGIGKMWVCLCCHNWVSTRCCCCCCGCRYCGCCYCFTWCAMPYRTHFVFISIFFQSHMESFHLILFISTSRYIRIFHLLIHTFGMLPNEFSIECVVFFFRSDTHAPLPFVLSFLQLLLFSFLSDFIRLRQCEIDEVFEGHEGKSFKYKTIIKDLAELTSHSN